MDSASQLLTTFATEVGIEQTTWTRSKLVNQIAKAGKSNLDKLRGTVAIGSRYGNRKPMNQIYGFTMDYITG